MAAGLSRHFGVWLPAFAASDKAPAIQFVNVLHHTGLLTVPSGNRVIRLLPPLNLSRAEAEEAVGLIESVVAQLSP